MPKAIENSALSEMQQAEIAKNFPAKFYPAPFIYCALPYRKPDFHLWERENGSQKLVMTAGSFTNPDGSVESYIPYGKLARAALLFLTSEAKKTGSARIDLSKSYRGFMEDLGLPWNPRNAKDAEKQLRAVLSLRLQFTVLEHQDNGDTKISDFEFLIGRGREIVFDANADIKEKESYLLLSDDFMQYIVANSAVPINQDAWRELLTESKSPMALDIFLWLSSRLPNLEHDVRVSWPQLMAQFGSTAIDIRDFKKRFRLALDQVLEVYPQAKVIEQGKGQGKIGGFKGILLKNHLD